MLSPALYRFCRSEASFVRSAPVTLVPFLRVSVTPSSRRTEAAAGCRLVHCVSRHDHARSRDRLPTRQQKIVTIADHRRAYLRDHPIAVSLHARATRSARSALQRSSTPSGSNRTRSGPSASTAPSSCVTRTIAPRYRRRADRISARLPGSRLLVVSSISSTFAPETTSRASASLVFSPPESTPAGLATS